MTHGVFEQNQRPKPEIPEEQVKKSNLLKGVLPLYALSHGTIFWLAYHAVLPNLFTRVSILGFGVIATLWIWCDAREQNAKCPGVVVVTTLLLPVIGVPVYLYLNQRSLFKFLGYLCILLIAYMIGTFLPDIFGWVK